MSQSFKGREDWSKRWWEVPFGTIIDELRAGYAKIPVTGHHLEVLEGANTVDDLRAVFQRRNIATDRNPYDTASLNKKGLDEVLRHVHDLRRAWMDLRASEPIVPGSPEPSAEFDAAAYLSLWSDDELLARALCVIDDAEFVSACNGCKSLNEIRERLGLDPEVIDARRQERLRGERKAERQRRTFNVLTPPLKLERRATATLRASQQPCRSRGAAREQGCVHASDNCTPEQRRVGRRQQGREDFSSAPFGRTSAIS